MENDARKVVSRLVNSCDREPETPTKKHKPPKKHNATKKHKAPKKDKSPKEDNTSKRDKTLASSDGMADLLALRKKSKKEKED